MRRRQHTAENAARVKEFHDADVEVFALLPYGNNFATWSRELYAAVLKAYPTAKGTSEENSHETAALCPSDPLTWKVIEAYVKEWAQQTRVGWHLRDLLGQLRGVLPGLALQGERAG